MIKTLRKLKGWSQLELAKYPGISQTNISPIENGRVEIGKLRAISLRGAQSPSSLNYVC